MYMKAAVIYEAGGPQQLKIRQVPVPSVKEGWSLIKIKGFGLNYSEIFTRKGLSPTVSFPRILGIECTGNRSFPFAHRNQGHFFHGRNGTRL